MKNQKSVLLIEEDAGARAVLRELLQQSRHAVLECQDKVEAFTLAASHDVRLLISSVEMLARDNYALLHAVRSSKPQLPCVVVTGYKNIPDAVKAIQAGVDDYLVKPLQKDTVLEMVSRLGGSTFSDTQMVVVDPRSQHLLELARKVADSTATVMISGESGSGKEVFARYIHKCSPRADKPFIAINCAAIPETMLESILFGHEKGTFTGAHTARAGKFEQANGGTLLLDEISEMDLGLQAKLLRVIQEKEVERLGGSKTLALDVRLLATTNRNLKQEVQNGRFREDLFYRLNVFPLHLPPLRERRGDIVPLAQRFIENFEPGKGIQLDAGACAVLSDHNWQGNVRELENVIQRALILSKGSLITADSLVFEDIGQSLTAAEIIPVAPACGTAGAGTAPNFLESDLRTREKEIIIDAVASNTSRKEAAEKLGISPRTLRYKLARFRKQGVAVPA
jgi:two-component system response regulator FlrC